MSSPTSPLLRPPSRSISSGSPSSNVGGATSATSSSHVVYARPRGLSNRTPSNRDLKLQTQGMAADSGLIEGSNGQSSSQSTNLSPGQVGGKSAANSNGRKRSSSIVSVQAIPETYDEILDQEALVNINADWVNFKGAWIIHIVLIATGKLIIDIIPGMNQTISWTLVLQLYMMITFLGFHWVTGTPFSANGGAFDRLTFWEQIDQGAQNTPARKFLITLPIVLFLLTTHYVRYDLHATLFTFNLVSMLLFGLAPKLPQAHRVRLRFFDNIEIPSGARAAALEPLKLSRSRGSSPAPQLTENNVKTLDSRGPPTPIEEVSEPQTPINSTSGTPTAKKRFLS